MASPGMMNKKRLLAFLSAVTLLFFVLFGRLGYIQLVQAQWLQEKAADQWTRDLAVSAKRGDIQDRNGNILAQSASADTVVVRPSQIKDVDYTADKLSEILEMDRDEVMQKLTKDASEVWLKRQVESEQADAIRQLNLSGVVFTEDSKRYYPRGNFLSQVLGFCSVDGQGQEGLELKLNKYLAGTDGRTVSETDTKGREMPYSVSQYIAPQDGYDVTLTIDYVIQSFVEKAMEDALVKYNAKAIQCVVMDPQTGEVLAMGNKPDFDLNDPPRDDLDTLKALSRNSCVVDVYEPGSTFKIITTASALELGVTSTDAHFNCPGYAMVDGEKIKCWRSYNPHGDQTLAQAVQNSCNPAFVALALAMGKENFYDMIYNFGFGSTTDLDFTGEASGIVRAEKYVKNVDLARIGFGQSIAVSPMQLITAVSAVANGGNLMKPYLVKSMTDSEGNVVEETTPTVVRQVISSQTSDTMRQILEDAVTNGSKNAYAAGYRVAGKTGTAQKYVDGKIDNTKHVASFVGFAPADDPQICVLFIVDEATGVPSDFGGTLAAPYARQIIEDTLKYMKVKPQYKEGEGQGDALVAVPNLVGKSSEDARKALEDAGLVMSADGTGATVTEQDLPEGTEVAKGATINVILGEPSPPANDTAVQVPDVTGKTPEEANVILTTYGLQLLPRGNGVAVAQSHSPGTTVTIGTQIAVDFRE